MKKEIISVLAFYTLFTGCTHVNQTTAEIQNVQKKQNTEDPQTSNVINIKDELISFYDEWKGTSYKVGGNTKKGIDSSALTQRLFNEKFYTEIPRTASEQSKIGTKIKKSDLYLGDILIFKIKGVIYSGVYMGKNEFMHSSIKGVKIDRLDKAPYINTYRTARRVF